MDKVLHLDHVPHRADIHLTVPQMLLAVAALTVLAAFGLRATGNGAGNASFCAPVVGNRRSWVARVAFLKHARSAIDRGYLQFKDSVWKLCGDDMLILPAKFVEELRNVPEEELSSIRANVDNFQGVYSATAILAESNLHTRVIQTKLTPKLNPLVPILCDELDFAINQDMPPCEGKWVPQEAFGLMINLISRISSRLFVGEGICRDMEWLCASRGYTENAFKAIIFLRMFPTWIKVPVSLFVPYVWLINIHLFRAKRVLYPLIRQRRESAAKGTLHRDVKFDNLLQFMDDFAQGRDKTLEKLAGRTLVLTLASSHTTSMAACQALFQMCQHPEYIPELRKEVESVLQEDGGWSKSTLTKLKKLDSFIKESQRMHPPSLLGFKRSFVRSRTLSDGTIIPSGAHTLMAIQHIQGEDPRIMDPDVFDGFRYYRMRQEPGQENKLQFATTDSYSLHFGHGKYSCPGRFLASNVIKLLLSRWLLDYEFRFPPGSSRPADVAAHEYVFPNPAGIVEFKRRVSH